METCKKDYGSMFDELQDIQLPKGNYIKVPETYYKKLILFRCHRDQDLYSSRRFLEKTLPRHPMPRDAAFEEIKHSIVWYWERSEEQRKGLEARYLGLRIV